LPNGGVIYNTLNGDSNVAFFKQMQGQDWDLISIPQCRSALQKKRRAIGPEYLKGHYAAWNYFQTVDTPANKSLLRLFLKIR